MGEIVAKVELENPRDHGRGPGIPDPAIEHRRHRRYGWRSCWSLPQNVVERLGLEQQRTVVVTYADERKEERPLAGAGDGPDSATGS